MLQTHVNSLILFLLLSLESKGFVVLGEEVCVLLVGRLLENCLLPEVRSEEGISLANSSISGFSEVSNCTSTSRCRDQSHPDRATFASHLSWDSMRLADLITPESSAHRHNR